MSKESITPIRAHVNVEQLFDPRFISCAKCRFCLDDKNRFGERYCVLTMYSVPSPNEIAFHCPLAFDDEEENNGTDT